MLPAELVDAFGVGVYVLLATINFDLWLYRRERRGHLYLAHVLRGAVRLPDLVARWGGEEFVILLPETDLDGAIRAAEHMRAAVAASRSDTAERITASFGVAAHAPGTGLDEAINAADRALYRAKEEGRNRVVA